MPAGILAAGGTGARIGNDLPKQFLSLEGRPLLAWSLDCLLDSGCAPIVVTLPRAMLAEGREIVAGVPDVLVIEGGADRQGSVRNGLQQLEGDLVVIHDGARPFADAQLVKAVLHAVENADGAISCVPVDETIKEGRDDRVVKTIDRAGLYRSQTPQAFRIDALRTAHEQAARDGHSATDDAELIERAGGRVALVEGSRLNIKVTYPDDMKLAVAIARGMG